MANAHSLDHRPSRCRCSTIFFGWDILPRVSAVLERLEHRQPDLVLCQAGGATPGALRRCGDLANVLVLFFTRGFARCLDDAGWSRLPTGFVLLLMACSAKSEEHECQQKLLHFSSQNLVNVAWAFAKADVLATLPEVSTTSKPLTSGGTGQARLL